MNKPKLRSAIRRQLRLSLFFAAASFISMLLVFLLLFISIMAGFRLGFFNESQQGSPFLFLVLIFTIYLMIGFILSLLLNRLRMKPILKAINAIDQVAGGDYSVRLTLSGPEELRDLGDKFNHMAEELGSVELLRNDFVNNFSHEFKTPIVSIRGFARMLKMEDLTSQERDEYLDIIIEESERLSDLSTNVLNLSKLEQQSILTDRQNINISEQIRRTISLMDSRWSEKRIEYQFDCEEMYAEGNEELLKQVWINLLDNAIKFSPAGGTVRIDMNRTNNALTVRIANQGEAIPLSARDHLFEKFYQGDTSHAEKGSGLGLTIVHRIMELHGGSVSLVSSEEDLTIFQVQFFAMQSVS